jgi:hypothetical protein
MALKISETFRIGPFRVRLSESKRGARLSVGSRVGRRGWISVSEPIGGKRRKKA